VYLANAAARLTPICSCISVFVEPGQSAVVRTPRGRYVASAHERFSRGWSG
jgi:hypothetical protein